MQNEKSALARRRPGARQARVAQGAGDEAASAESAQGERPGGKTCPQCGAAFVCGMDAGAAKCWCADLPPLPINPALSDCLCPACLQKRANDAKELA